MTKIQIEDASRINRFMSFQEDITWRLRHLPSCWDNRAVQERLLIGFEDSSRDVVELTTGSLLRCCEFMASHVFIPNRESAIVRCEFKDKSSSKLIVKPTSADFIVDRS